MIQLSKYWNFDNKDDAYIVSENKSFYESKLLRLNCDKAYSNLNWRANLDFKNTVKFTSEWYFNYYKKNSNIYEITLKQIDEYENIGKEKALIWTV